jgi:hypothetical protein
MMNRPRLIRGLRIAWSVVCGVLCVLLIVLWMRSYQHRESLYGYFPIRGYLQISSNHGGLDFIVNGEHYRQWWRLESTPALTRDKLNPVWMLSLRQDPRRGFWWDLSAPFWFLVPLTMAIAAVPWIQRSKQFTLRTLLIATTLIAVVLGVVVWSMQKPDSDGHLFSACGTISSGSSTLPAK